MATADDVPSVQRAWHLVGKGDPAAALLFDKKTPVPMHIPIGEIMIKIQATALNPLTGKTMRGMPNSLWKRIAEFDYAGIVVDGNGSDEFKIGDAVFGTIWFLHAFSTRQGCLAEYARVPVSGCTHRPPNISPIEASGLATVGVTALQCLFEYGKLEPGQSVLINGGSSGVGSLAIQIAKNIGCKVVAISSGKNEKFVKDLGADGFLDYTAEPVYEQLVRNPPSPKFHLIVDCVGIPDPWLYSCSEAYLAPNGIYVSVGPQPSGLLPSLRIAWYCFFKPRWAGGTNRTFTWMLEKNKKSDLEKIRDLVAQGKVKPVVDSVHKFEDSLNAYDKMIKGPTRGKVVVEISV